MKKKFNRKAAFRQYFREWMRKEDGKIDKGYIAFSLVFLPFCLIDFLCDMVSLYTSGIIHYQYDYSHPYWNYAEEGVKYEKEKFLKDIQEYKV